MNNTSKIDLIEFYLKKIQKLFISSVKEIKTSINLGDISNLPKQYEIIEEGKKIIRNEMHHIIKELEIGYSALEELDNKLIDMYFEKIKNDAEILLKTVIRNIENKTLRKKLNAKFRLFKEKLILEAIKNNNVSWNHVIKKEDNYGIGMDERIVELPLAIHLGDFLSHGKVLDAGCSLNLSYIWEQIGKPVAKVVHFTQSAEKEEILLKGDRISYVFGDLRNMDFKDETFDRILCISTIEHIGMNNSRYGSYIEHAPESYIDAIKEMFRVLKQGGKLLLTFPYGEASDLGWYHVFDETKVLNILTLFKGFEYQEKYFYYDGCWYEGTRKVPQLKEKNKGEITGIAAILIIKRLKQ